MKKEEIVHYGDLLGQIKSRVRQAQHRAALSANAELIALYWDIGGLIATRQKQEGWGAGVIPRLAADLKNELPEEKGFSERNIKRMLRFYREYSQSPQEVPQSAALLKSPPSQDPAIVPQPVAQTKTLFIPLCLPTTLVVLERGITVWSGAMGTKLDLEPFGSRPAVPCARCACAQSVLTVP